MWKKNLNLKCLQSPEFIVLALLLVINAISIFGFVVFTLNPSSLARWPWAVPIYTVSYQVFAQLQIVVAFVAMVTALVRHCGRQWVLCFVLITLFSGASELVGTSFGMPFGPYSYTDLLGPKIFGKVPYLIPLSWFFMSLPSYWLGVKAIPISKRRLSFVRVPLASLLLLSWDLTLDPAMSFLTPFWLWGEQGDYYGMPFSNLIGWFVTGLVLMIVLEVLNASKWLSKIPGEFLGFFYLLNILLPFAMALFAGLWGAVFVTLSIAALYLGTLYFSERQIARGLLTHGASKHF